MANSGRNMKFLSPSNKHLLDTHCCVTDCNHPTLNCHLWPAPLYRICPHYVISGTIFAKKKKSSWTLCFRFSLQLMSEIFLILRRSERNMIKNVYWPTCKVPVGSLGGLGVACWPLSTQVRGFKPGRSCQDFSGRKNPQHFFLRGNKAVGPMP